MSHQNVTLVDAHVHIHDCFDLNLLLDSSYSNFEKAAKSVNAKTFEGVLCLTESSNANWYTEFRNKAASSSGGNNSSIWQFHITDEPNSVRLTRNQDEVMYIIAGRQIITKEKLEVLGIGLLQSINDGEPLADVVEFVNQNQALPVIPWGAGKWTGYRKKIVRDFIVKHKSGFLFLGDNSNRPFFWIKSSIFTQAESLNISNLPGTDPLPFKTETTKAGKYGFVIDGRINPVKPFEELRKKIIDANSTLLLYGKPETTLRFIRNQFLMQLVKRRKPF